jgi:hypothetical protein
MHFTAMRAHRLTTLALLAAALLTSTPLAAQVTARASLDTAAILASARPEIDAANTAWVPGLRTRIAEWGRAWIEFAPAHDGEAPLRRGGSYLTVWERGTDGHWRITRNVAF